MVCKYFLPICSLQFHPLKKVFHRENFHEVQYIKLSLLFVSCLIALVYTYPHFSSFRESSLPLPPKNLALSLWFGGWEAKKGVSPGQSDWFRDGQVPQGGPFRGLSETFQEHWEGRSPLLQVERDFLGGRAESSSEAQDAFSDGE